MQRAACTTLAKCDVHRMESANLRALCNCRALSMATAAGEGAAAMGSRTRADRRGSSATSASTNASRWRFDTNVYRFLCSERCSGCSVR
ncbi:hypothetical protein EON67_01685 [archaeon]|nr:MAG: hypothetical protein EON67_01685 [archaeon]